MRSSRDRACAAVSAAVGCWNLPCPYGSHKAEILMAARRTAACSRTIGLPRNGTVVEDWFGSVPDLPVGQFVCIGLVVANYRAQIVNQTWGSRKNVSEAAPAQLTLQPCVGAV